MLAGILAVVLLLVGLPLLMFWVGGRAFWNRSHGTETGDLYRRMVLAHGLRPAEIAQVEGALTWGRELQDERLRAAVVDWAQELQVLAAERRRRHPTRRRILLTVLVLWGTVVLVVTGVQVAHGDLGPLVKLGVRPRAAAGGRAQQRYAVRPRPTPTSLSLVRLS